MANLFDLRDIVFVAFMAGWGWMVLRQVRKDVNGIGSRQRKFETNAKLAIMMLLEKPDDRTKAAEFFRE